MLSKKEFDSITKDFIFYNSEFYGLPDIAQAVYQDFPEGYVRTFYLCANHVFVDYLRICD